MAEKTSDKILHAAKDLFGEHGYSETTFKKISERSGVTLGLITHHFGSKDRLFIQATLDVIHEVRERVLHRVEVAPDGITAVRSFMEEYLACSVDPAMHFTILVRCSPYSDVKTGISIGPVIEEFEGLMHILAKCLIQGMNDGTIMDLSAVETADIIFATIVGSVRTQLLSPFSFEHFYEGVIEFVLRSIEKKRE